MGGIVQFLTVDKRREWESANPDHIFQMANNALDMINDMAYKLNQLQETPQASGDTSINVINKIGSSSSSSGTSTAPHAILSTTHSDVTAAVIATGDMLYVSSASRWARLAKGTDGQFLKMVTGYPAWSAHGLTYTDVGAAPTIHNLVDTVNHPVAGLTPGHFMKALSATTYGFAAHGLTYSDVGAEPTIAAGVASQFYSWDKTWRTVDWTYLSSVPATFPPSAHNLLSASHGDTVVGSVVAGDLIYGNVTPAWTRLAIGLAGDVLTVVGGYPVWQAPSGGGITSLNGLSAAAQLFADVDDTNVTLAIASVTATHTFTLGWTGTLAEGRGGTNQSTYAQGDILYASAANTLSKLPIGTAGYYLTVVAGVPAWTALAGSGITSLNGLTAAVQTFADVDDTNVTLAIASVTSTHTFTLGWTGALAEGRGGTNQTTYAVGDTIYASALNTLSKLTIGSAGQFLKVSGGIPAWQAHGLTYTDVGAQQANANLTSLAGLTYVSTSFVKMTGANTFGLDTNTYLTTVTPHNLLSATHSDTTVTSAVAGDMIYANVTPAWTSLAIGTAGQFLKVSGGYPVWAAHGLTYTDVGAAATIHNLVDTTNHPVTGLTAGHFMKALSPTTYGFAAHGLTYTDVGAQQANANLTSLAGLTYVSTSFVKMTGANTFSLDTNTYETTIASGTTAQFYRGDKTWSNILTGGLNLGSATGAPTGYIYGSDGTYAYYGLNVSNGIQFSTTLTGMTVGGGVRVYLSASALYPNSNDVYNLGGVSNQWHNVYAVYYYSTIAATGTGASSVWVETGSDNIMRKQTPANFISTNDIRSGTVPINKGGTNKTSYTTGSVIWYDGTSLTESNSTFYWLSTDSGRLCVGGVPATKNGRLILIGDQTVNNQQYGVWCESDLGTNPDTSAYFGVSAAEDCGYIQVYARNVSWTTKALTLMPMGGNLAIFAGTTSGSRIAYYGGGTEVIYIKDASVAPSTSPTGGGIMYSSADQLKWRDAQGWLVTFGGYGIGYSTGCGGTVTQATSKSTGVTLNKPCGQITMHNAALAAGVEVSFTLTNSYIATTDTVIVNIDSVGTVGSYGVFVTAVGAGSCSITLTNLSGGSLSQAVVLNFSVIKAVTS